MARAEDIDVIVITPLQCKLYRETSIGCICRSTLSSLIRMKERIVEEKEVWVIKPNSRKETNTDTDKYSFKVISLASQ